MNGAIIGDIIGSVYEGDPIKSKNFPLLINESYFTDDTVMSIAVSVAMIKGIESNLSKNELKRELTKCMQIFGRSFPNAGYGSLFIYWLYDRNPRPYHSAGNGAAMRVSSVGWLFDSIETTREMARISAEVSHNHPEGIKSAEAVAAAIYLARNGSSKEDIKNYISNEFNYDLDRTCDEIRPGYYHTELSQDSVPESIIAFLEGESFTDVIRLAVSLGGDSDTMACIAGSIAEAYYEIPEYLLAECKDLLPYILLDPLEYFNKVKIERSRQ